MRTRSEVIGVEWELVERFGLEALGLRDLGAAGERHAFSKFLTRRSAC